MYVHTVCTYQLIQEVALPGLTHAIVKNRTFKRNNLFSNIGRWMFLDESAQIKINLEILYRDQFESETWSLLFKPCGTLD